ncbi:hypothetical protein BD310DRAFT_1040636 [Dichomitus squalens]|uniref:GET complex subunit GET2 n=1 Tax=Dichomitus squalens TaxID=114155 RepID=A0A4Q9PPS9_9APHY|nr:hypothetical protein BD310DRAFT_1040636 [Dichomitus squalens]
MADAKARAEARRKAILARGGDRLARITTSARGEEATAYMKDAPSLPSRTGLTDFVGETSDMPTPPASTPGSRNVSGAPASHASPLQAAGLGASAPDPSVWSEEQQQQFMNALIGAAASGRFPGAGAGVGALPEQPRPRAPSTASSTTAVAPSIAGSPAPPLTDDPMAALMNALQQGGAGTPPGFQFPGAGMAPAETVSLKPKTLLQKLMPVIHIISAWALLAYFALWKEPEAYDAKTYGSRESLWRRWAELSWKSPEDGWGVQAVPFFWAFTTLALVLHSWRIFTRLDPIQPPMLLAFALPHLPSPLPAIITNGLKYLQIGGILFDDISALLVGIGLLVWIATWFAA